MAYLAVRIEHRDLVRIVEIATGADNTVDLTTIKRDQQKAVIEVFAVDGDIHRQLCTFVLPTLPRLKDRKPLIQLKGTIEGTQAVLRLSVERRPVESQRVDVRRYLPRRALVPILLVLLLLCLGGGAFWLLYPRTNGEEPAPAAQSGAKEERRTTESGSDTTEPRRLSQSEERTSSDAATDHSSGSGGTSSGESAAGASGTRASENRPTESQPGDPRPPNTHTPGEEPSRVSTSPSQSAARADTTVTEPTYVVYFQPNSAVLTPETQRELQRVQREIAGQAGSSLRIVGHTALAGTEAGRIELSWERARAVQAFLSERGAMEVDQAQIVGRGGEDPVVLDEDLQHLNRRVEVYVGTR